MLRIFPESSACFKYLLGFFLLAAIAGFGDCQDEVERTCQSYLSGTTTTLIPLIPKCLFGDNLIKLRLTNIFEALPRIFCVIKCLMAELGVLGEDGLVDEAGAAVFSQESLPEYALAAISTVAGPCLELTAQFKPKEYYCQSYRPVVECFANNVLLRGIGPFALECYGTPFFAGLFGLLNFVVPPVRASDNEVRRNIQRPGNRTGITSKKRLKPTLEKINQRKSSSNNTAVTVLTAPNTTSFTSENSTTAKVPQRAKPTVTSSRRNFSLNNYYQNYYHFNTNNTNSITYQMDRLANLAKSLQILTNNMTKPYRN